MKYNIKYAVKYAVKFLPNQWILNLATINYIGYKKYSGTLGVFIGVLYYFIFFLNKNIFLYLAMLIISMHISMEICELAEIQMHKFDPPEIILDEIISIPFIFIGANNLFKKFPIILVILLGILIFRILDTTKILGIDKLQRFYGGLGVIADDIGAAIITCILIHIIFFIIKI